MVDMRGSVVSGIPCVISNYVSAPCSP
ncbi:hypothetical protein NFJ02_25g57500 [Pycnococcus provasolii]